MKKLLIVIPILIALGAIAAGASVWQYGSYQERAEMAAMCGIFGYRGTAQQNLSKEVQDCFKAFSGEMLGFSVITRYRTTLSSSMTSSQTTIPVSSMKTFDGDAITMAMLGSKVYLTVEPGSNREEIIKCTGISGSNWTGCTRGLAFSGTDESSVAANRKAHNAGSTVVISNVHYVYEQLTDTDTAQSITANWDISGFWNFDEYPIYSGSGTPTNTNHFVTKNYVDGVAISGAPTSTESVFGFSRIGTLAEIASSFFNVDEPAFISTRYTTSTPSANIALGNIPAVDSDGKLSQLFFDLAEQWNFTSLFATSATTTRLVVGSTNPTTNDAFWVGGNSYFNGNATTTGSLSVDSLCFNGANCIDTEITIQKILRDKKFWLGSELDPSNNGGSIVQTGSVILLTTDTGSLESEYVRTDYTNFDLSQDFEMQFSMGSAGAAQHAVFAGIKNTNNFIDGSGNLTDNHAGFIIGGTTLYSSVANGTTQSKTDITSGITIGNINVYRIKKTGSSIEFYVNGTLKDTITTNLSSATNANIYFHISNGNGLDGARSMRLTKDWWIVQ